MVLMRGVSDRLHCLITYSNSCVVGFTGSGKPMRSDPARQKHRYEQVEQDDE